MASACLTSRMISILMNSVRNSVYALPWWSQILDKNKLVILSIITSWGKTSRDLSNVKEQAFVVFNYLITYKGASLLFHPPMEKRSQTMRWSGNDQYP